MRRCKCQIYLHSVWATKHRQPLVTKELEAELYPFIGAEAKRECCQVLVLGGMPDHVHLILRTPGTVCVARLIKQIKGASSSFANDFLQRTPYFRWQEGYGSFSLCEPVLSRAIFYVQHQKRHHALGPMWHELEETDEDTPSRAEDWLILPSEGRLS